MTQIAGPDLIKATVQPHEFLDFMIGKLSRRFIDSDKTLQLRLSETDNAPDADIRYRVNDFFCYENTWKFVLDRLVRDSDVVLMDLRGFSRQNAGCVFEIEELMNIISIEHVVFIIDKTTDDKFLDSTMIQSWEKMTPTSPNRFTRKVRLFRLSGLAGNQMPDLLRSLADAALAKACGLWPASNIGV